MKELLDGLLRRLFPELLFQCVPHEGWTDLERSIPRKLSGWREPGVRFAVVRDNDGGDCHARKQALRERSSFQMTSTSPFLRARTQLSSPGRSSRTPDAKSW